MNSILLYLKPKNSSKYSFYILAVLLFLLAFLDISCKKLVETPPPAGQLAESNVFSTDASAISVLNNLYISMNGDGQPIQGFRSISLLTGLSSDELTLHNGITSSTPLDFYKNNLSVTRGSGIEHWQPLYSYIFKSNAAFEGLTSSKSEGVTPGVKKQLLGEVQFLRGLFYFYLVNLYGDVPLCITTDAEINAKLERSSKENVYQQIIFDLTSAEENLSTVYLANNLIASGTERVRPIKWAASALLAKVYLYMGKFAMAEEKATSVINNTTLFDLIVMNNVFLKNSREAIWQLQPTDINFNTRDARTYILTSAGPNTSSRPVYLSNYLITSFELGDLRGKPKNWIDTIRVGANFYSYPYKYKIYLSDGNINTSTGPTNMKEYFMMLRLGEQYLIRAEARAQQNNLIGSINDLDKIRNRAGLSLIANTNPTIDKIALLAKILHEKQVELFSEGGNRWFDLKRTSTINSVMDLVTTQKSKGTINWQSYQQLYPIPKGELEKAKNLVQNPGY